MLLHISRCSPSDCHNPQRMDGHVLKEPTQTTTRRTTPATMLALLINTKKMWLWPKEIPQKVRLKSVANCNWLACLLYLSVLAMSSLTAVQCNKYPNRPPRFLIDGHSEIVLRLKEGPDTPVGSLIYKLRGADPDNDALVFGIRDTGYGSDVLRIENIGNNEANLYLAQELDREVRFIEFASIGYRITL